MPFTPLGWVDEKPAAKLYGGGGPGYKPPTEMERAINAQRDARSNGSQVPPNLSPFVAPTAGQMSGPAYRGGQNDVFSPQGFGVTGLKDVFGVPLPTPGVPAPRKILPTEETVTNAAGVVQTGKNLGGGGTPIDMTRSFNSLLEGVGQQPFGGSQLPTTMGNPYTATYKQTQGFGDEIPDIGGYNGVKFDSEGGRNAINSTNLQDQAPLSFSAPFIEGGSERIAQQATGITSGRLSDALNGVREQEAGREMTPERRQQMARAAFLNAEGPMNGLKARDAVLGKVFAGGKYYISGESGDDQAIAIEDYQARDMNTGKTTANALLAEHIAKNKGNATPAETQEPPTIEKPGIKQSFGRTETISTPIDTSIPDTTAFNINNGVDVPAFRNKGGYMPMSKKSEVDYSSIFSY